MDDVARFGTALHVTGADKEKLGAAVAPYFDDPLLEWDERSAGLEEAFIHLMTGSEDNF